MTRDPRDPFGIIDGYTNNTGTMMDSAPEVELDLIADVQKRIDNFKTQQHGWHALVEYLILMQKGEQHIVRRRTDKTVLRVISGETEDIRRRRSKDNQLHICARAFAGKATRIIPSVTCSPATNDRSDLRAAEVREAFLDYFWRKERLRVKWKRGMEALTDRGAGIMQLYWDPDKGPEISVCESEECEHVGTAEDIGQPCAVCSAKMMLQQMEQQAQQGQESIAQGIQPPPMQEPQPPDPATVPKMLAAVEGDVKAELHDARDFLFDTSVTEIEDMSWCGVKRVLHVSKIRRMFPKKWNLISPEEGLYSDRYLHYSGSLDTSILKTSWLEDHSVLYEIHEAPSGENPDGRIIFMCNSRVLDVRPNIYYKLIGRFPFFALRGDRRPDMFLGEPLSLQAEDLQKEYNELLNQMREHRALTNNPKVVSPFTAGVSTDRFTTTPGEHIRYHPNAPRPPEYLKGPEMPSYVFNETERLKAAIREKYGVTEHDLGSSSGDQSGRFAAFLEAQSAEAISPILIECYEEWLEFHRGVLIVAKQFMSPDRVWTIQGQDRVLSFSWLEADDQFGWDVSLTTDDSLSKNPMLRLQQAQGLLAAGVFNEPTTGMPNMKAFMRTASLKLPGLGPDIEGTERAYAQALPGLIEKAMQNGEDPLASLPIRPFDNAKIMAEELLGWLQANRMKANPQVLQLVMMYWMQYASAMNLADPTAGAFAPNPALAGQQQAPGAQPAQTLGAGGQPAAPEAQGSSQAELIQGADQRAESVARGQENHEG